MTGLFDLETAADLRKKLRHDYELLLTNPLDTYGAFNFFVTAEHLLDWQYPGYANAKARSIARDTEVLLQITSHLANGAKHFVAQAKHHTSVAGTWKGLGDYFGDYFGNYFGNYFGDRGLVVELDGSAAKTLAPSITVPELAKRVMAYWDAQTL